MSDKIIELIELRRARPAGLTHADLYHFALRSLQKATKASAAFEDTVVARQLLVSVVTAGAQDLLAERIVHAVEMALEDAADIAAAERALANPRRIRLGCRKCRYGTCEDCR